MMKDIKLQLDEAGFESAIYVLEEYEKLIRHRNTLDLLSFETICSSGLNGDTVERLKGLQKKITKYYDRKIETKKNILLGLLTNLLK